MTRDHGPDLSLNRPLERHHRARERSVVFRYALRATAWSALIIVAAVLVGTLFAPGVRGSWARLLAVALLSTAGIAAAVTRFRRESLSFEAYLEQAEQKFPVIRSWLRNALDFTGKGTLHTSTELASAVTQETGRRLGQLRLEELRPALRARRPLLVILAALAVVVGTGLVAPARTARSWSTLWNPNAARPPVRIAVEPGSVRVSPGASLAVRARVWGSRSAPRLLRDGGPVAASFEGYLEDGARLWRMDLNQVTRAQDYRVKVESTESPRYHIALAGEPSPVSFEIEYHAPSYARLPVQRASATRGDLSALAGTRARVVATFDRDLRSVEVALPGRVSRWKELTPRRWEGEILLDRPSRYELRAVSDPATGAAGEGRFPYRIEPLADAPPVLAVQIPQGDVDLPAGQQVPLAAMLQDDLGLASLSIQYRKDPNAAWTSFPLSRFGAGAREAQVENRWDASPLGLLPGETAVFRFVLTDNNAWSGPGQAVSPTYELRFPSLTDLYERVDEKQQGAQATLTKAAEQMRDLQKSLDKLARQQPRAATPSSQSFERSEELKSAFERQQQLGRMIEDASQQLRQSLEQAADRQAFDQQLMRKLQELNELTQQIQSKEFKEALKRMAEALEKMDRRATEQQVPEWRRENQEMLQNLERTIELLKKIREEEKLHSLAQRARELEAQQESLNREHEANESKDSQSSESRQAEQDRLAAEQRKAAEESRQLEQDLRESGEQNQDDEKLSESLEEAAKETSEATPAQEEAAESAQQGKPSQARQSGKQAQQSLSRAASRLQQTMAEREQQQEQLDLAAVRRAAQDLVSLQRATEQNLDADQPLRERADRQTDLSEGAGRVADSLFALAQRSPFISPRLAETLGRAINNLGQAGREMATGNRARGEEAGRAGSSSLNEAVLQLREAEGSMCQMPGNSSQGKTPSRQRLGDLSQRQSQLNRETRSMAQRLSEQMRLSSGSREEMRRMADEQARIRAELEEIRRNEEAGRQMLGRLDQTEREMQEVEEVLRAGESDASLEEKQQRILSRLLDAQRSIHRRDFDPHRESRPGEELAVPSPPELSPDLLRASDRLRLDLLKAESDRYPAQYRSLIEIYLRALNGSRR